MEKSSRFVPIQILIDVIKNTKAYPDPSGTPNTFMHYSRVFIRGKEYNLEVLYHVPTNTIYHFKYSEKALGPLSKIN